MCTTQYARYDISGYDRYDRAYASARTYLSTCVRTRNLLWSHEISARWLFLCLLVRGRLGGLGYFFSNVLASGPCSLYCLTWYFCNVWVGQVVSQVPSVGFFSLEYQFFPRITHARKKMRGNIIRERAKRVENEENLWIIESFSEFRIVRVKNPSCK